MFAGDILGSIPAPVEIPVVSIAISLSVFMTIILFAYYLLQRYETKMEKRASKNYMLAKDKNSYNEKFSFLENQEVSASTI